VITRTMTQANTDDAGENRHSVQQNRDDGEVAARHLPWTLRQKAAKLCKAVYDVQTAEGFCKVQKNDKNGDHIQSMAYFNDESGTLFIIFRGTVDIFDMITDCLFTTTRSSWRGPVDLNLHRGAHGHVVKWLENHLSTVLEEQKLKYFSPARRLIFCGHSVGGCFAQIALMEVLSTLFEDHRVKMPRCQTLLKHVYAITFDSPQPFHDGMSPEMAELLQSRHLAIVHGSDPVPHLPSMISSSMLSTFRTINFHQQPVCFDPVPHLPRVSLRPGCPASTSLQHGGEAFRATTTPSVHHSWSRD